MVDEIEQIRQVEMRRGRRPVDMETVRQKRRTKAAVRNVLENDGTEEGLKRAMRAIGLSEKSPKWNAALRVWRDEYGQK